MTCSRKIGRLLQVGYLGLIGTLAIAGCGGSETSPKKDGGPDATSGEVGQRPNINATPASLVFSTDVGKPSSPQIVTVTNTGTAAGVVTVAPSGAGIAATGCTGSLAALTGTCQVSITVTPAVAGQITGSVLISIATGNSITIGVGGVATPAGNFSLNPSTTIPLGDLMVGATAQATVTVTAGSALTGMTFGVQGPDLKLDPASDCTPTLAASATCKVVVTFTASATSTTAANAVVVSQGGVTKTVSVTANVLTACKLVATPALVALAAAPGTESPAAVVTVGNIGGMACGQAGIVLAGANASSFKVAAETCSVTTLAAGANCTISVVYAPAGTTVETATLSITDKGVGASVASVNLTGTPNLPSSLELTPISGNLGTVPAGKQGVEVLFTVTNKSTTPSGAINATVTAPVVISSNTCTAKGTLAANETCTIGVKLSPAATATAAGVSTLLTVAPANGNPVSASLTGAIVGPSALSANPSSVSFGSIPVGQTSSVTTVTITNTGATATGTLTVVPSGAGAAQVAITANTCTGTLAPAAVCTFALQFAPTDTTGVNGTILVSDGTVNVSVAMVGTGLAPTPFEITGADVVNGVMNLGTIVVGYPAASKTATVGLVAGTVSDSGAISTVIEGGNNTDFSIVAAGTNCSTIQPGETCTIQIGFTPTAVGARQSTLTISGAKGGVYHITLKGNALALAEIVREGCATEDGVALPFSTTVATDGLDFRQQTLGKLGAVCKYVATVRGASATTAVATTAALTLATSTPPDFRNVTVTFFKDVGGPQAITGSATNPCNGQALTLLTGTGLPADAAAGDWSGSAATYWTCPFYVQFTPQTSKGDKTATLTLTSSAGGTDPKTLAGQATGPLTFGSTSPSDHGSIVVGQSSTPDVLTLTNNGVASEGPLTVVLGGTNPGDFGIVADGCSGATLVATDSCNITVAFAPTSLGAKAATVRVTSTSSSETADGSLTGTGAAAYNLTLAPASTVTAPVLFGQVAQAAASEWTTFTITNPEGGALTGKLSYGIGGCAAVNANGTDFQLRTLESSSTGYPAGSCGDRDGTQLAGGANCTVQVRFRPTNEDAPNAAVARTDSLHVCVGGVLTLTGQLSGIATPQLTLSGTAITIVNNSRVADFGNVAKAANKPLSFTVTNNGLAAVTLTIPTSLADSAGADGAFSIAEDSGCKNGASLAAQTSCTLKYTVTAAGDADDVITATATITDSDVDTEVTTSVLLKATPVDPADIVLYGITGNALATPLEFGKMPINSPAPNGSGIVTVWFKNEGGIAGTGLSLSLNNSDPADANAFALAAENKGTCDALTGGELAAGATCSVRLRFKPTTTGSKTAQLTLTATDSAVLYVRGDAVANPVPGLSVSVVGGTDRIYTFPSTAIAASNSVYLQLSNAGSGPYAETFVADGGNEVDFTLASEASGSGTACAYVVGTGVVTVPASGICQLKVTFTPAAPWVDDTRYRWTALEADDVPVFGLIGQALQPAKLELTATTSTTAAVDATLATVDFGQILADTSPTVVFTIRNVGETATGVAPALTLSADAQAFAQIASSTCTAVLAVDGTCTVTVSVKDTLTVGAYDEVTATATATAAAATSSVAYKLKVRVVNPSALKVSPSAEQAKGSVAVGAASAATTVTIINGNVGDTPDDRQDLAGLSVNLSNAADFILGYGTCATLMAASSDGTFTLVGGASCDVTVTFSPTAVGALESTLTARNAAKTASVKFTGTGVGSLAFAPVSTTAAPIDADAPVTLTVTNSSASATGILRTTVAGTNRELFVVTTDNCYGQTIDAGDDCTITIGFIGTLSTTARTATVTVTDGSPTASATAYLSAQQ